MVEEEELIEGEPGEVIKGQDGNRSQLSADNSFRLSLELVKLFKYNAFGWFKNVVKAPQDRQGQNDLPIFISFVCTTEQIADAPDEVCCLAVRLGLE